MSKETLLQEITQRLVGKTIHELRQIARIVGVSHPTDVKKERLIVEICAIAANRLEPAPRSARGAPPKSTEYDRLLVDKIYECRSLYGADEESRGFVIEVANPDADSSACDCAGILKKGATHGFLRTDGCFASYSDVFVNQSFITRYALRDGDEVEGKCIKSDGAEAPSLISVYAVNGKTPPVRFADFGEFPPAFPQKAIALSTAESDFTLRIIELFSPLGFGQRAVIIAPPHSGKTALLKELGRGIIQNAVSQSGVCQDKISQNKISPSGISRNNISESGALQNDPQTLVVALSLAARPEESAELGGVFKKFFFTTFDMEEERHAEALSFVIAYCRRQASAGKKVVLLADGLSNLPFSSGLAIKLLSAANNAGEAGSVTVVAALSDDSDGVRYLSEAANCVITLAPAAGKIFPMPDVLNSYTVRCELMQTAEEVSAARAIRRAFPAQSVCDGVEKLFTQAGTPDIISRYKS